MYVPITSRSLNGPNLGLKKEKKPKYLVAFFIFFTFSDFVAKIARSSYKNLPERVNFRTKNSSPCTLVFF